MCALEDLKACRDKEVAFIYRILVSVHVTRAFSRAVKSQVAQRSPPPGPDDQFPEIAVPLNVP